MFSSKTLIAIFSLLSVFFLPTMTSKTALVIRATGSQGKAVVKHLAKNGWNVHALVTDASSERAIALKQFGERLSLYEGSLGDISS